MIAINVNETITQNRPATATVVNFGVSFLHLNVTENIEKPIDEVIPKIDEAASDPNNPRGCLLGWRDER